MHLGVKRENIYVVDSRGVIWDGRDENMEANKRYAQKTDARTLADVVNGADVFLGCSTAGVLTADMVKTMADRPLILALANPEPEIRPEVAKAARPDCIIATGRSDYPNQVNNVLCFLHLPRRHGRRRLAHHGRNEAGLREGHRRPGPGRAERRSGPRLRRPGTVVRPRLSSPSPSIRA